MDSEHVEMGQTKPGKRLCLSGGVLTVSTDVNQAKWLWRLQLGRMAKMETRGRTKKRRARVTKQVWLLKSGARSESKDYLYTPADLTGKLGINQYGYFRSNTNY